jgi:hypothetical protein
LRFFETLRHYLTIVVEGRSRQIPTLESLSIRMLEIDGLKSWTTSALRSIDSESNLICMGSSFGTAHSHKQYICYSSGHVAEAETPKPVLGSLFWVYSSLLISYPLIVVDS